MNSVFESIRGQLHPHKCFEGDDLKFDGSFRFFDFGQIVLVVPPNFLAGVEEMDSTARFALRSVDERIDVEELRNQ